MRRLLVLIMLVTLVGCGPQPSVVMCEVLGALEGSHAMATEAFEADEAGDPARAQELASDAAEQAEDAEERLQTITDDDTRRGATWQALLMGHLRVGQGANALLPEYAGTYGMTAGELASGRTELDDARRALDC